jgi:hypothetical protein
MSSNTPMGELKEFAEEYTLGGELTPAQMHEICEAFLDLMQSENATINGGRGQGLPESREAGQGLGMPSSQAENEATRAGYRASLPSHEQPIDIEERIRWHKSEARRLTLESIRGGQPSDIGDKA